MFFTLLIVFLGILIYLLFIRRINPFANLPRKFNSKDINLTQYDYVVVGAGSSGCVLTNRLIRAGHKVLLLENGGEAQKMNETSKMIHNWVSLIRSDIDYEYSTVPQKGFDNRKVYVNRGKTLGGCSTVNANMFVRGNKNDYDNWETVHGAKGWKFEDVLPSFNYCENYKEGDKKYRGKEGPIIPRNTAKNSPIFEKIIDSIENSGVTKRVEDYNYPEQTGVGYTQESLFQDGRRADCFTAFIEPLIGNRNLKVVSEAKVHKIIFNSKKQVIGVKIEVDGSIVYIEPKKEVILCAGAINSPQLLLLSGIGDKEDLEKLGIESVYHNPHVGKNLHDHPATAMAFSVKDEHIAPPLEVSGSGLLVTGFYQSSISKKDTPNNGPDIQVVGIQGSQFYSRLIPMELVQKFMDKFFGGTFYNKKTLLHNFQLNFNQALRFLLPKTSLFKNIFQKTFSLSLVNNQPFSRGFIKLASNNVDDAPIIDPRAFEDPRDLEKLVEGVKNVYKITETSPLSDVLEKYLQPETKLQSDEEIRKYIRNHALLAWHPVGTCKMGSGKDCVVDSEGRVIGVENLRVADASIMPAVISGNTNWPSMMIGSRISEFINSEK
eukprot:TRINITY_DN8120_c0_g1_i1.p1 TRINITY_DN8120_c0_g1~~TRINITY_DN8120_c0_g1_i1.p1  ORF type:complete len:604 (-),score=147.28 TRINITY_DN8120_c0_g1_i1:75-1886(-)